MSHRALTGLPWDAFGVNDINKIKHPAVFVVGFDEDDPRLDRIKEMAGTYRHETALRQGEFHPKDWDVYVVRRSVAGVPKHANVLVFGQPAELGWASDMPVEVRRNQPSPAMTFHELPAGVKDLKDELSAELTEGPRLQIAFGPASRPDHPNVTRQPWITDRDDFMLAGAFKRRSTTEGEPAAWCWVIPYDAPEPCRWLAAAFEEWRRDDDARFPARDPWTNRPKWLTPQEQQARDRLVQLEEERAEQEAQWARQEAEYNAQVTAAARAADDGVRRLLTHHGEPLVEAVTVALESFGFTVTNVDQTLQPGEAKREDLHITSDETSGTIIAEVKGLTGGAKANDITKLALRL